MIAEPGTGPLPIRSHLDPLDPLAPPTRDEAVVKMIGPLLPPPEVVRRMRFLTECRASPGVIGAHETVLPKGLLVVVPIGVEVTDHDGWRRGDEIPIERHPFLELAQVQRRLFPGLGPDAKQVEPNAAGSGHRRREEELSLGDQSIHWFEAVGIEGEAQKSGP